MITRPEALVGVASPGQACLQMLNLDMIPFFSFYPWIIHMRNHKHETLKILGQRALVHVLLLSPNIVLIYTRTRHPAQIPKSDNIFLVREIIITNLSYYNNLVKTFMYISSHQYKTA